MKIEDLKIGEVYIWEWLEKKAVIYAGLDPLKGSDGTPRFLFKGHYFGWADYALSEKQLVDVRIAKPKELPDSLAYKEEYFNTRLMQQKAANQKQGLFKGMRFFINFLKALGIFTAFGLGTYLVVKFLKEHSIWLEPYSSFMVLAFAVTVFCALVAFLACDMENLK